MRRRYVVTGSASGIGAATAEFLKSRGGEVIGVDRRDAEVIADLSSPEGRTAMIAAVENRSGGVLDAVITCAGSAVREPSTFSVNYFGAVATLEGLRPMLARGTSPRAVAIGSISAIFAVDGDLVNAGLADDEPKARALAEGLGRKIYWSSKAALVRWCRAAAIRPEWARAGILLNVVSPGQVETPMSSPLLHDPVAFAESQKDTPLPSGRFAQPVEIAQLLAFLSGPENSYIVGQNIFADGGSEAMRRGPSF